MAYGIVQQKDAINTAATSIATGNFGSNPTAGNLIHVVAGGQSAAVSFNTPTDTLGNTYLPIGTVTEVGTGSFLTHWYAKNITGGAANSVTVTTSGTNTPIGIEAVEISGLDPSNPLHVHSEGQGSVGSTGPNAMTSGSASTTLQPAAIVGFEFDLQGTVEAAGTSPIAFTGLAAVWSNFGGSGVTNGLYEHARLTTTGSVAATFQDTGFDRYCAVMAVFLETLTAPAITQQPISATVLEDGRAQFSVNALVSAGSLTYQWQDNRSGSMANITDGSGATSAAYTTSPARVEQNGRQVRCVVTDSNGSTNTNTVSLSVVRYAYPQFPRKRKQWGGMSMGVNIREWW